ncbi:class II histone deacetylase [Pseudohalocynthiibacter aestuariivivens]|uniref:Class II histone deacetylase n=1 Tax=Pseudohalocynthiibacter aestuariivivens TaxID=1591409 RepID=A0ABV5JD27_9RHOB|nr:class II histone deacetylase [Pseudohalocynthiibacter aestuariivivens]MBS9717152.1 class II histone deacetylase [Pseudohalocynthiibacter aestuariivivens]
MTTGFFWDERTFWHGGGNYASMAPVGGLVQPMGAGGLPENPETKRRLVNLLRASGLWEELHTQGAPEATHEDLLRVHPEHYLTEFKKLSDAGGGELGLRTPFGPGGYEMAALSAGLSKAALCSVLKGEVENSYALSRPPGHHCLPDFPNGFCLMANLAIAIEAAFAEKLCGRVAVIDWDVHHGNGTEAIYYERDNVLAISLHQERNYPQDTGFVADRGEGAGKGCNINIPLPPGGGHVMYLEAMDRIVMPALYQFKPDVIVIANGYDASALDMLSRMLATANTFAQMTTRVKQAANDLCNGRLMMAHEGGYSELYVPFCGHAVLSEMSGSKIEAPDPLLSRVNGQQPSERLNAFYSELLAEMQEFFS